MVKKQYAIMIVDGDLELSVDDICHSCDITPEFIQSLIEYGVIQPKGYSLDNRRFDQIELQRVHRLLRLQNDLEVNLPGAALAIDLMDQMVELKAKVEVLEKLLSFARIK